MMPLVLFGSPSFVGLTLLTFLLYGALGALMVLLPYTLIEALRLFRRRGRGGAAALRGGSGLGFALSGRLAARIGARALLTLGSLVVAAGFLLCLRIGTHADYWTAVLPAILLVAVGMAGAVAPLTAAVLISVDSRHTGSASGLNSAVARTGGMVATALLGGVLGAVSPALIGGFHASAIWCALACLSAAGCAYFLISVPTRTG